MATGSARSSAQSFEQFQQEVHEAMRRVQKDRLHADSTSTDQQIQNLYNHVENVTILLSDYINNWSQSSTQSKESSKSSLQSAQSR